MKSGLTALKVFTGAATEAVSMVANVLINPESVTERTVTKADQEKFNTLYTNLIAVLPYSAFGGKRVHLDWEKTHGKPAIHCYVEAENYGQKLTLNNDGTVTQESLCYNPEKKMDRWENAVSFNSVEDAALSFCTKLENLVRSDQNRQKIRSAMHVGKQVQLQPEEYALRIAG